MPDSIERQQGSEPLGTLDERIEALFKDFDVQKLRAIDRELRQVRDETVQSADFDRLYKVCVLHGHFSRAAANGLPLSNKWVRCAKALGERAQLRRALTVRAALRRMAGDVSGAMEDNLEAYEVARSLDDALGAASVLSNLSILLGSLEIDAAAVLVAEHSLELLSTTSERPERWMNTRAVALNNLCDRLLWSDPARALRTAVEAERSATNENCERTTLGSSLLETSRLTAVTNQLIATLKLRDEKLATAAADRLKTALRDSRTSYPAAGAASTMATYEARYGDAQAGERELRRIAASGDDGGWQEASKLLVEILEEDGRQDEAFEVLQAYYSRLQKARRTVALEELRSIDALEDTLGDQIVEDDIGHRVARYRVAVQGANERFKAKLQHFEQIAVTAEVREGSERNRAEHIFRVGHLASLLAGEAGCSSEMQWLAEVTGRLHDIGKCAVPDTIIMSGTPLNQAARQMVRDHADYGARLVADADEPRLVQVVAGIRHHHERFDGSGYPTGLKGEEIPLLARLVSLCESFDAMLQSRVYRTSRTVTSAIEEIERCAGTQFDPSLAGLFIRLLRRLQHEHGDVEHYLGAQARGNYPVQAFERLERLMADTRSAL